MAGITAALVKELRELTGAGMMDCKKALTENNGDMEPAVDWLRKNGLAAAAKKAGRAAAEGLVGVAVSGGTGAVVEVNAETDFVARNGSFQEYVAKVTGIALADPATGGDVEALKAAAYPGESRTVDEQLTHMVSTIGENMNLRRSAVVKVEKGVVVSYMHNALVPGLGKIGVLVGLQSAADPDKLEPLGRQLAMHVAAANPIALSRDGVDAKDLQRERDVLSEQARASGKPDEIIAKMVEGRLRKYYEEVCLLEQTFVIDNETKIEKVLENAGKEIGSPVSISSFVRLALGEGVEKKEEDFAAEVAAVASA